MIIVSDTRITNSAHDVGLHTPKEDVFGWPTQGGGRVLLTSQVDSFHERASQLTGLHDFGSAEYQEPLRNVLADYDEHNDFSPEGLEIISSGIVGLLVGRLMAHRGFKSPSYRDAAIKKPIILVGMMRTGSTALHRLLAQDPGNQWLPMWLGITPMPRPPREQWEHNPAFQQVVKHLEELDQANPNIRYAHPMVADGPDECRFVLDQSFWSPGLGTIAAAPQYAKWCLDADAEYAYRYHRKVLSLIGGSSERRWLLKDVIHIWALESLLTVYPDACVVFIHRDPVITMKSAVNLIYEWRRLREPNLSRQKLGLEELALWGKALDKAERVRRRHRPEQFFDVTSDQTRRDPLGTATRIYRHFHIDLTDEARTAWHLHVSRATHAGESANQYSQVDYGFDESDVLASVGAYAERYQRVSQMAQEFEAARS